MTPPADWFIYTVILIVFLALVIALGYYRSAAWRGSDKLVAGECFVGRDRSYRAGRARDARHRQQRSP